MCSRTNIYNHYLFCAITGHKLPAGACDKYAHGLQMCLDDPNAPRRFDFSKMHGRQVWDHCRFCKEGRDLEGGYKYGEMWQGR